MYLSVKEFQEDPLQYIALWNDNIILTHEGKEVARLMNLHGSAIDTSHMSREEKLEMARSLIGIIPEDIDLDTIREERLAHRYGLWTI